MLLLIVPLLFINRDKDAISEQENRPLSGRPSIFSNGSLNKKIFTDTENYLNDRIGFRDNLIACNALIQYHIFNRMENGKRYRLGPDGEFNIIENDMLETYQHLNLLSDKKLASITDNFQTVNDYLKEHDCDFYYMQCYDKQTIYPEYFPTSVNQYGEISRTDQLIKALQENTDVKVIDPRNLFMESKEKYEVYSKYSDPVHWTPRGAFIGYNLVMDTLNSQNPTPFKVLSEDDFNISITDQGMCFYNGVKRENFSEEFERKNTDAVLDENYKDEHPVLKDYKTYHFTNKNAQNDTKVMIIGNSFIVNYLMDDFAESFGETLMVWDDIGKDFPEWFREYQPDIVIFEMVERYNSYSGIKKCAKEIKKLSAS